MLIPLPQTAKLCGFPVGVVHLKPLDCQSRNAIHKDKLGHILVEVYLELNDGGDYDYHNCCFYVDTELGLLEEFSKKLYILKEPQLGKVIKLNQY